VAGLREAVRVSPGNLPFRIALAETELFQNVPKCSAFWAELSPSYHFGLSQTASRQIPDSQF
jgi:hypothetical protein